ncbi:MAG: pimeloyl-ACP methyl ester esterase BioH [Candidatus Thiodiazotropha sp. (ex Epidulcina cf. delphinae)]|nr:pimeloyl-ACP methyl ester esterase BioH [Candidatus Thiodiazotropha sp. (ex Epidulcina cf. delphinae)]
MRLASETRGSGRDLVMIHGWGMNSSVWSDFADRLAANYRITLVDLPGHGNSPFAGQRALEKWADACLDAAPDRAVWLGWSLGAMVSLQAALLQPARIEGIVVLAGTPRFVQGDDWPDAMAPRTLDLFIQILEDDHGKALERFLALQMLGSDLAMETLRRLKSRLRQRPDPHPGALEAGLDLLKNCDLREGLESLDCPTVWVYGERDTLAPAAAAGVIGRWLPEAETHVIRGAAHTPFLSHPAETHRLLIRRLESLYER